MHDRVLEIIARALEISPSAVADDMEFNTTPNWDSLTHMSLMLSIEEQFGIVISDDDVIDLTTVGAIRRYVGRVERALDGGGA